MKKVLLWGFVVFILYAMFQGATQDNDAPSKPAVSSPTVVHEPGPTRTVKVKVPGTISQDCKEEMSRSAQVTATTRALSRVLNKQQLIQDASFEAIIDKDWAALNEAKQLQINLDNEADPLKIKLVEQQGRLDKVRGSCHTSSSGG